ncbi:MAG: hypothetical protein PHI73_00710 [Patescibacteria group bacterium]|nr:hypothetical protein [Patescibacteria group bacterium]
MSKPWPMHISLVGGEYLEGMEEIVSGIITACGRRNNSVIFHYYSGRNERRLGEAVEQIDPHDLERLHLLVREQLPEGLHRGAGPEDWGNLFGRLAYTHGIIILAGMSCELLSLFFFALSTHANNDLLPGNRLPLRIAYLVPEGCDPTILSSWDGFLLKFLAIENKPFCFRPFLLKVTNAEDAVNWALEGRRPAVPTKEVSAACH